MDHNYRSNYIDPLINEDHDLHRKQNERKIKKKSLDELLQNAKASSQKNVGFRNTNTKYWIRSASIVELAKKLANGICQLCNEQAPFKDQYGEPYLETHHIEWLANGGADTPENTVALCPNCHKKMHVVNSDEDKKALIQRNLQIHLNLSK